MDSVLPFDRRFFRSDAVFSRIGEGGLGGKADGLIRIRNTLDERLEGRVDGVEVGIPRVVVIATGPFDQFMEENDLHELAVSDAPDDRIAHAFQNGDLPTEMLGDLRSVAAEVRSPLAVRSSSLLEDAVEQPFAGIYETKMIPNNQPDADTRYHRLVEAVKLIWASTYFSSAKTYRKVAGIPDADEKMAVMIQEIVGRRYGDRFYPDISAVCRSYSYYTIGRARPEDGVVSLALGLGKTIVDGGLCWSYAPTRPKAPRPFTSTRQMLQETQSTFWAVNMGRPPAYDPIAETEYLLEASLEDAEYDGTLRHLASTYDAESDRLRPGMAFDGPRVLDFAPLLQHRELPLNDLLVALLEVSEEALGTEVEIELAIALGTDSEPTRAGFVQVRPMRAPSGEVEVTPESLDEGVVLFSDRTMGNGVESGITDVVYVKPDGFEARHTEAIAGEIERVNRRLVDEGRPYLLMGFGRWGSSDPWLGIPVLWGHVAGVRVLVEATLPAMDVEPSQGSHFFHNLSNTGALYFSVHHSQDPGVDWDWLDGLEAVEETSWIRHVRTPPLEARVDGRTGRGMVRRDCTQEG
ncbi:MAG: PEP/pyruvate-binding domain-containing protein [Longimicrobiales bacterium]